MENSNHAARIRQTKLKASMKAFLESGGEVQKLSPTESALNNRIKKRIETVMLSNEDKITSCQCEDIRRRLRQTIQSSRTSVIRTLAGQYTVSPRIIRQIESGEFFPKVA